MKESKKDISYTKKGQKNNWVAFLMYQYSAEVLDNDRELLDKMADRLEHKYGEFLWK